MAIQNKTLSCFLISIILSLTVASAVFSQVFSFEKYPNERSITLPSGTLFRAILQNEVDSGKSTVGDKVYMELPSDVKIGKETCIEKRTVVEGQVIMAQKAKAGKNGSLQIKFDRILYPDGTTSHIFAHVWSNDEKGVMGGELTKQVSFRKMPHYIENIDPIVQLVPTGERAMGTNKCFNVGTEFVIVLDSDLVVRYLSP